MISLHANTRVLRFLLVLSAVILTIFIYASYSSTATLVPPHMRVAGTSNAASLTAALTNPQNVGNKSIHKDESRKRFHFNATGFPENDGSGNSSNRLDHSGVQNKKNKKAAAGRALPVAMPKKTHHREPTSDVDTVSDVVEDVLDTQNIDTKLGENFVKVNDIYESGHMNEELNIDKLCPDNGIDIKLLILITSALVNTENRMAIRQTWAHYGTRRDVSVAFILGQSRSAVLKTVLSQENVLYGDLIRGNSVDSYNNLTLKTISALEWVDQHCAKAKYILKTDDDMFINVPKLLEFLDNHSQEKRVIYGYLALNWKPIRNIQSKYYISREQFSGKVFPPFTAGTAYVISSDVIHDLYKSSLNQVYLKLEDVFTTGIVAQQLGIRRVHVNGFFNQRLTFHPCIIRQTITVAEIKWNEQFDLWKKLLDKTIICKQYFRFRYL